MKYSLYFFSADGAVAHTNKYQMLLETVRYADAHRFYAVWVPERHFVAFGGLYPNPTVMSAALATMTQQIRIRAGSLVLPLHHTVRVAEDWAMIDNLSGGRVGMAVAMGWHPNDFVFAPDAYADRREVTFREIKRLSQLWAGDTVAYPGPDGRMVEVTLYPRPIQERLPLWISAAANPETWRRAGQHGLHVLSALMGQTVPELAKRIRMYWETRADYGYDPDGAEVTIMLHTHVGEDEAQIRDRVQEPLKRYIRAYMQQKESTGSEYLGEADKEALVDFSFARYFESSSLLGSMEKCGRLIAELAEAGVTEVACLVDFGLDLPTVMEGLRRLSALRERLE